PALSSTDQEASSTRLASTSPLATVNVAPAITGWNGSFAPGSTAGGGGGGGGGVDLTFDPPPPQADRPSAIATPNARFPCRVPRSPIDIPRMRRTSASLRGHTNHQAKNRWRA